MGKCVRMQSSHRRRQRADSAVLLVIGQVKGHRHSEADGIYFIKCCAPPSSPAAIQSCEVCFCVFGRGRGAARLHVSAFPSKVRGRRVALGPNLLTPKLFPAGEECKVMDSNGRTLDPVSLPDSQTARPPPSLLLDQFGQRMCRLHQFPFHW